MTNETTDFHEPPKPGTEFIPIDPDNGIDAVYCCKCREDGFCASEQLSSALSLAGGQVAAFFGESTS